MGVQRLCKSCGRSIIIWNTAQTRCPKCQQARSKAKPPKPIRKQGKHAQLWKTFRDQVARPYLDKKYGIKCADCGVLPPTKDDGTFYRHDVDHIKSRGSSPDLRYDVKNLEYRCRSCHRRKTDGKGMHQVP